MAVRGLEIAEFLKDPPKDVVANSVLAQLRSAALVVLKGTAEEKNQIHVMCAIIHAAYWLGKGANLGENVLDKHNIMSGPGSRKVQG